MKSNTLGVVIALGISLAVTGCKPKPARENAELAPGPLPSSPALGPVTFLDFPVPAPPALTPALLARGQAVFARDCAACHGVKGDGHGQCSAFLLPRPRDFTRAEYRLRTTPSGALPTDADLFRVVSLGVNGTPMPPWRFLLAETDRWAVVEYVKAFSPRFAEAAGRKPSLVDLGAPPPRAAAAVAAGHQLFERMGCANCHGPTGQGDGPSAYSLTDDSGQHIAARDFSKPSGFKAGYATKEIVRGFLTGFNGTPMPSFEGALSQADAWRLAYYVETLVKAPVVPVTVRAQGLAPREVLGPPDVRIKLTERAWHYDPAEIRVRRGQIVEVTFEPTDNGLGAGHGFAISSYDDEAFINGAMVGAPKTVKFRARYAGHFTYYCATQCSTDKLHPLMNGTLIVAETGPKTARVP